MNKSLYKYLPQLSIIALALLCIVSCNGKKVNQADLDQKTIVSDSAVISGVLDNGLTYIIRHNKMPEQRAMLYLVNKIGSVQESENQRGIAHFVEHMAFRGTKNFPEDKLINFLELSGVKFGADLNAYTSYNETVYQLPIPSYNKGLLDSGLMILKDWAQGVLITEQAVNSERGVILAEMRQRQGLDQRIRQQSLPTMLNGAPYSERSPIGIESVIKQVKASDLQQFYDTWYRPNLQAIIVVGDLDPKMMEQEIKKRFADLKNPSNAPELKEISIPKREEEHYQMILDDEIPNTTIQILRKFNTKKGIHTEGDLHRSMVNSLFNTMLANRINDLRSGSELPFLSAGAAIESIFTGLGSASLTVTFNPGEYEKGYKSLFREIRKVKELGFNEVELDRAKASFIERQEYQYGERDKVSSQSYINVYVNAFLKEIPYPSASFYHNFYTQHVTSLTLDDFKESIDRFYTTDNKDIFVLAPTLEEESLPTISDIENWEAEVNGEVLTLEKEKKISRKLMETLPKAGQVISQTQNDTIGITIWKLSNGVTVVLKPTTYRNDQLLISAYSPGGSSLYSDEDYQSTIDAVGVLSHSGIADMDHKTLSRVLTGKIMKVNPYIGENEEGISASSSKKDLEACMQLIHLQFTQPRLDMDVMPAVLKEAESRAKKRHSRPANVYADSIRSIQYGNHFRKSRSSDSRVSSIVPKRSLEIYKERFADASNFTFVIVGSIELEKIKPLVEQYLASLPTTNSNEETNYIDYQYAVGPFSKTIRKGKTDKATVTLVFDGNYTATDELIGNMTALRDVLKFRMTERLRGKENQVYSPWVSLNLNSQHKRYDLRVGFVCSPSQVNFLIEAVNDEFQKLAIHGAKPDELVKFKTEFARGHEVRLKRNDYWLSQIQYHLQQDKPLANILQITDEINAVNAESFKKYAKEYLNTSKMKSFILLPEL
ncbi:M16 family metallopeptidase [Sphingobacterium faecale]|uniref:Insulinase family protein n=1 Tax=Sphingobacterium faecale TaxID=2803775 RepID=A0ABS1R389_9SPHI|nr:insulinase family protein [Sphingobacterium faecale]MBL1409176.1 insulinase family protein [Sphingobacterium faecale]